MKYFHIALLLFISVHAFSQNGDASKTKRKLIVENLAKANKFYYTDLDSAVFYAKKVLVDAKKFKENALKAKAYLTLSNIHHRNNDLPKSFEYVELAEIVGNELDDLDLLAKSNFQKGTLFMVIGNNEKAIEYLSAAQEFCIENKDSSTLAVTYNSLSLIYKRTGNIDKAISTINKSIKLSRANGQFYSLAISLGNLSQYFSLKGDPESALTSIRETLKLFVNLNSYGEIARSYVSIADLYLQEKNYDSCVINLNRAEEIIVLNGLKDPYLDLWTTKADYEMSMHQFDKALQYYNSAYALSKEFGISELMKSSLENMYKSAKASGNISLALNYLEQFKNMSDSLEKISGREALVSLELNQNFENKQRLSEIEKNELIIKEENGQLIISRKNYLILSLILAGFLVIFIAYLLVRRKTKAIGHKEEQKQELNDELELRNKELVSNAIQILRKNEEMKQTISSLQELNKRATPIDSKLLLYVIRKLNFELEHSTWEEFEVPFKQLHSRFYTNLIEKYPELTGAEIKVCALLKLSLDTKQISSILHKTPASIEVDRSRIRKKMGLINSKLSLTRHIITSI